MAHQNGSKSTSKRVKSERITVYIDPLIHEFLTSPVVFGGVRGSLSDAIRHITITHPLWQKFIDGRQPATPLLPVVPTKRSPAHPQAYPPIEYPPNFQHPPHYAEHEPHPAHWVTMDYQGRMVWVDPEYPFPGGESSYDEAHTDIGEQVYSEDDLEEDPPGTYDKTYDNP